MPLTRCSDMRDNSQMRAVCKSAAVHFVLVAMLLRALLPAGWMPAAITRADASPFVICTVDGPLHAPAKHEPAHDRSSAPCVFAAAAPLSSPAAHVLAPLPVSRWNRFDFTPLAEAVAGSAAYRPNAARAPPASV
jgi:hypothetical protein